MTAPRKHDAADIDEFEELAQRAGAAIRRAPTAAELDHVLRRGRSAQRRAQAAKIAGSAVILAAALAAVVWARRPEQKPIDKPSGAPWMAHVRTGADGFGIYLVHPDGTELHRVFANVPGVQNHPDWSTDGRRIVFAVTTEDGTTDVWVSSLDGHDARVLVDCAAPCRSADEPSWNAAGNRIVFHRDVVGPAALTSTLEAVDLDTAKTAVLATAPADQVYLAPQWSPDGSKIAVEVLSLAAPDPDAEQHGDAIGIFDTTEPSAGVRVVTDPNAFGEIPDWSPDGTTIVYAARGVPGRTEKDLFTIHPDGTANSRISHYADTGSSALQPAFQPDGRIIFVHRTSTTSTMMTVNADGTEPQPAAGAVSLGEQPDTQPTG